MKSASPSLLTRRKPLLVRLSLWTLLWVLSEALVIFGHTSLWAGNAGLTIPALLINLVFGIGMVLTYRKLLKHLDELERMIQLESMGLTLGLTLVAGVSYSVMDVTNLISTDAEIGFLILFMGLCYMACIIINTRRYC